MRPGGQKVLEQKRELLDPLEGWENPQINSLNSNPEIVLSLQGRQRAPGKVDLNPKTLAEPKKESPSPQHSPGRWKSGPANRRSTGGSGTPGDA